MQELFKRKFRTPFLTSFVLSSSYRQFSQNEKQAKRTVLSLGQVCLKALENAKFNFSLVKKIGAA